MTKADGTKFGKTESGAVWLTAEPHEPVRVLPVLAQHVGCGCGRFRARYVAGPGRDRAASTAKWKAIPANASAEDAYEATKKLHGEAEADAAVKASQAFG